MKDKGTIFESAAKYTNNVLVQDDQFVTAALAQPQDKHFADVPGSHKYPRSIEHAPIPKIGKDCC